MESKNYVLLARSRDGFIHEKVKVNCTLDSAATVLTYMMAASPRLTRGEIIEGDKTHLGDFSVKPTLFLYIEDNGEITHQKDRR